MALGNTSASSLLKSSASISNTITEYNDKMQAFAWNSSAQTDADYAVYAKYLEDRIKNLSSAGTLSASSKMMTLSSTLQGAQRSYTSNAIQRATIGVLEGSGSLIQKQQVVKNFYDQAVSSGDMNLAQNLYNQYANLDVQIQNAQITAQNAAEAQAKKDAAAVAHGYDDQIHMIDSIVNDMGTYFKSNGGAPLTAEMQKFSKEKVQQLKAAGIDIPDGMQLTTGSLIQAALNAKMEAYVRKANAYALTDPASADTAMQYAQNISDGVGEKSSYNFGGVNFNLQGATTYAQNPLSHFEQLSNKLDENGNPQYTLAQAAVNGYTYDKSGNIVPVYANGSTQSNIATMSEGDQKNLVSKLQNMGFTVETDAKGKPVLEGGQIRVTATNDSRNQFMTDMLKNNGLSSGSSMLVSYNNGNFDIAPITGADKNRNIYTIGADSNGKYGLYMKQYNKVSQQTNNMLVSKNQGYDELMNTNTGITRGATAGSAMPPLVGNIMNALGVKTSSQGTANNGYTMGTKGQNGTSGYWFKDATGKSISAENYSKATGMNMLDLISQMAKSGDAGAASVLRGPGIDSSSANYQKWFAWDMNNKPGSGGW